MIISASDPLTTLFHKALAQGSKSTVLKPLGWLIGICSVASIGSFRFQTPIWIGTMFGIFAAVSILLYLVAYIYFGLTDKDSLRSEKFYLQKMAIQQGFVGDDVTGYIKLPEGTLSLPSANIDQEQKEAK